MYLERWGGELDMNSGPNPQQNEILLRQHEEQLQLLHDAKTQVEVQLEKETDPQVSQAIMAKLHQIEV